MLLGQNGNPCRDLFYANLGSCFTGCDCDIRDSEDSLTLVTRVAARRSPWRPAVFLDRQPVRLPYKGFQSYEYRYSSWYSRCGANWTFSFPLSGYSKILPS